MPCFHNVIVVVGYDVALPVAAAFTALENSSFDCVASRYPQLSRLQVDSSDDDDRTQGNEHIKLMQCQAMSLCKHP